MKRKFNMIERPIPKEIKDFKEKLVFGLTARQLVATIITLIVCVPTYIVGRPYLGDDLASWICIIVAFPTVAIGFYKKNGMNFEQYMVAMFKFNFVVPTTRKYKIENFFEQIEKEDKKIKNKRGENDEQI